MTSLPDRLLARIHEGAFDALLRRYRDTKPPAGPDFVNHLRETLGSAFAADWVRWIANRPDDDVAAPPPGSAA